MLEEVIRKHALKNAHDHGKAELAGVLGKVIAEFPDAKRDMKKTVGEIGKAVSQVNKLKKAQIEAEMRDYEYAEKKEGGGLKFRLEGVEMGKVVTRFLPEPNGYLHIGHAKAAFLSYELARQYSGKCLLRFDDTNPEAESQEYVDAIRSDLRWLQLDFAAEYYTSDKMLQLQKFAEKMIILGKAYACTCSQEEMKGNRFKKKDCSCRNRKGGENLHLWDGMAKGAAKEGEMVLRFKGDMQSENSVMRDPTLFRVVKKAHYRQGEKYSAWPTYDFEVSISDSLDGVTHALRSKEYELRDELYYAILSAVNLRKPVVYDFSRLNIGGTMLSKRFLKPLVESGKVQGWGDPRLPTLSGLRRRGILPSAIREFVLRQGLSKVESTPDFGDLLALNRRLLDPVAPHYFFIPSPEKLKITGIPDAFAGKEVLLNNHNAAYASRTFKLGSEVLIPKKDADALKEGEIFRLKELFNAKFKKGHRDYMEAEFSGSDALPDAKKVQWVPSEGTQAVECEISEVGTLLDGSGNFNEEGIAVQEGACESACSQLKEGDIVQFERYGFCRLDAKAKGGLKFIFTC